MAKVVAETALERCGLDGSRVTVIVLDRGSNIRIVLRDDGAAPHTFENSQRKAYTALTFRAPSRELAERLSKNPGAVAQVYLSGTSAAGGGLPIKVGNEIIGAMEFPGRHPPRAATFLAVRVAEPLKPASTRLPTAQVAELLLVEITVT